MSDRASEVLVKAVVPARYWLGLGMFLASGVLVLSAVVVGWFDSGWVGRGRVPIALALGLCLAYVTSLLLWRAVCRGVWARNHGGIVEVRGQWRWTPVGPSGEVTYQVEPRGSKAVTVWLKGSQGRAGFNLPPGRTLEDSALSGFWEQVNRPA